MLPGLKIGLEYQTCPVLKKPSRSVVRWSKVQMLSEYHTRIQVEFKMVAILDSYNFVNQNGQQVPFENGTVIPISFECQTCIHKVREFENQTCKSSLFGSPLFRSPVFRSHCA